MKKLISITFASFICLFTSFSHSVEIVTPEWTAEYLNQNFSGEGEQSLIEDYSEFYEEGEIAFDQDDFLSGVPKRLKWLFELLIPERLRSFSPFRSERSFLAHTKDSRKNFIFPADVVVQKLSFSNQKQIRGKITYIGFVALKYQYLVKKINREAIIQVRVHFRDASSSDIARLKNKFKSAADIWNRGRIPADFKYRFEFFVEQDPRKADFSVKLVNKTRGPYNMRWSRGWNSKTIAHELGHMMGLGDEYRTLSSKMDCLESSLMCASWTGNPMDQHYYHILRRIAGRR